MCFNSLTATDWAAGVQAIGVFLAIYYSAKIGRDQSESQYKNALKLQVIVNKNKEIILTEVITEIILNTDARVKYVKDSLSSRDAISDVVNKKTYLDLDCLTEVIVSLKQIPLKDLPSTKLVTNVMHLTSAVRQLEIQMEKALNEFRGMNENDLNTFLLTVKQIKQSTSARYTEAVEYLVSIKSEAA